MKYRISGVLLTLSCFVVSCWATKPLLQTQAKPNILFILADDLGYGDVQVFNPEHGKIATPHMDQLAEEGMIFTDAHSSSSVCTPTRYGILTGRYNWRTRLQRSVLFGYSKPLIAPNRLTIAGCLKEQGYTTACIGKWHLGLNFASADGSPVTGNNPKNIDWAGRIDGGPVDHGFDSFFGISASLDMPPYIYIQNDHFVGEGTAIKNFYKKRKGWAEPHFKAQDVLPTIGQKTVELIRAQKETEPFFAYVALTSPHTPILPGPVWQGKSGLNEYADFVMHTDAVIGQIVDAVDAVDAAGLRDNTLIIVTSDNGCSKEAHFEELEAKGHFPSAQFRGSKSDLWDGGHRVPFIVRWPSVVHAGSRSDTLICLTDFMATAADVAGASLPDYAGEDSVSFLPALTGKEIQPLRKGIIHHSIKGSFAYREGKWKLLLSKGSGGWTASDIKNTLRGQLYDLAADPGETNNLFESQPEVRERLLKQLESDVQRGRSTPGSKATNDVEKIVLWKPGR